MGRFLDEFRAHSEGLLFYTRVQRRYMARHGKYLGLSPEPGASDWAQRFAVAFEESTETLLAWLSQMAIPYPASMWCFLPGVDEIMEHMWLTHLPLSAPNVADWLRVHGEKWLRAFEGEA